MEKGTDISVIIPVYNARDYVEESVHSVLRQKCCNVEIILVDDGSTDDSASVCEAVASNDGRVKIIRKANGGVSSARNLGLKYASGKYVMFLDADDLLRDNALSLMYEDGWDMILGGFSKISGHTLVESHMPSSSTGYSGVESINGFLDSVIDRKNSYLLNSSCFKLFRRELIERYGLSFDEGLRYGEDKMFVFSFLCHALRIKTIDKVVYDYMIHPDSLSSDLVSDAHLNDVFLLMERYVPLLASLGERYPFSVRLASLYHVDLIGRYVFRILTAFALEGSSLMNEKNISILYSYMERDSKLGLFSVRPGQVVNYMLYRIGKPGFTVSFYRFTSRISRYISFR